MTTLLLCLSCLCAGFILGRLKQREPVRRIKIKTLEPHWDFAKERVQLN